MTNWEFYGFNTKTLKTKTGTRFGLEMWIWPENQQPLLDSQGEKLPALSPDHERKNCYVEILFYSMYCQKFVKMTMK